MLDTLRLSRQQFQVAIEIGISAAQLHGTDYSYRLREIGRTAKVTRMGSYGRYEAVRCPAVEADLPTSSKRNFGHKFDSVLKDMLGLGLPIVGEVEIVDA